MAEDKDLSLTNSSRDLAQPSTETPSGTEAAQYARRFRGMWPQGIHSEEGYLAGLAQFFMTLPRSQVDAICNPTAGFITLHKFPPTIAEIHEWTKPHEPADLSSAPPFPGRNFTQERLAEEAAMRAQGKEPPEIEYKSRMRIEHPGDHDPHWLTHPDPDAPWRRQGPPSRELQKLLADDPDYQANLAVWRAKNP
jgi:hypothetical protein